MNITQLNRPNYRLLDPYVDTLADHQVQPIKNELQHGAEAYPELAGVTITVGRMPDDRDNSTDAYAQADPYNNFIRLPVGEIPPNLTVFHELAHLLIYRQHWNGENVPHTSEKYCSLVAVARMTPGLIYTDRVPYFGEPAVPIDDWPEIAQEALTYRQDRGPNSHYIKYAERRFAGESE